MPKLIRPPTNANILLYLQMLYRKTEEDLIWEIERKRVAGYMDYAEVAALERTQTILQDMVDDCWVYVPKMIEKIFYRHSAKHAAGYANARTLTATQNAIVHQLSNNLLGDIVEAAEMAQKSVQEVYAIGRLEQGIYRNSALGNLAEQQASGAGVRTAAKGMTGELQRNGITGFTDKSGRNWKLSDYCNMATRTAARQAEISAILTVDPEQDLYYIPAIGSTCPICAPLEGRVYSRSGQNSNYPSLTLAFGKVDKSGPDTLSNTYLNIHPNCLHALVKYTTIGKTDKQIKRDMDFSNPEKNPLNHDPRTKKQIEEYRNKVVARQKLLNDHKQYQRYKALELSLPSFQTFEKHKMQKSKAYKAWQQKYRAAMKEARKGQ